MSQDNASFTFLHRIEEVELNIEDGRWQSALALVLTLPDICGGIAFVAPSSFARLARLARLARIALSHASNSL